MRIISCAICAFIGLGAMHARFAPAQDKSAGVDENGLKKLLEDLAHHDSTEAYSASSRLMELGQPIVPQLIRVLDDKNSKQREGAAIALWLIRPIGPKATAALLRALDDGDPARRWALQGLVMFVNPNPPQLAPAVCRILRNKNNEKLHYDAVHALMEIAAEDPDSISTLIATLNDHDQNVRLAAFGALAEIGPEAKDAVPLLRAALQSKDINKRYWAAVTLAKAAPREVATATKSLIEALKHGHDAPTRGVAAEGLGELGDAATADAIPALTDALRDPDRMVRTSAAEALGKMGPRARISLPGLIRVVQTGTDPESALAAAGTAVKLDPRASAAAVTAFCKKLMADPSQAEWDSGLAKAGYLLGDIGPEATDAVPVLRKLLSGKTPGGVRASAAWALYRIGVDRQQALQELKRQAPEGLEQPIVALGRIGRPAAEAAPGLLTYLKPAQTWSPLRERAALALVSIDKSKYSTMALAALKADAQDDELTHEAVEAITALGEMDGPAVPILVSLLPDDRRHRRAAVARALGQIGPAAESALPALNQGMKDQRASVRRAIIQAMQQINATKCRATFLLGLNDPAWSVRYARFARCSRPIRLDIRK
jgi:HEAT repeat protein